MRHLDFYTDGAFSSKSEMGGWAQICVEDNEIIDKHSGYEPFSTNNRMELTAFLSAMESIAEIETANTTVNIYTDSTYIANCFNQFWYRKWLANGWKTSDKQDVKNQDLWVRAIALYIKYKERFNIIIEKVAAHKDNQYNNLVDELAKYERMKLEDK